MSKVTENSVVQIRIPVAPKSSLDTANNEGVIGYDKTSDTLTVCPGDGQNFLRMSVHPGDLLSAGTLGGSEKITVLQAGKLRQTTVADLGGGGGSSTSLSGLSDVLLTTPTEGQALVFTDGVWVNAGPFAVLTDLVALQVEFAALKAAYNAHSHAEAPWVGGTDHVVP